MTPKALLIAFGVAGGLTTGLFVLTPRAPHPLVPISSPATAPTIHRVDQASAQEALNEQGRIAHDIALPTTTGELWKLKEHTTKPIVLFFVEQSCPCCVTAKPFLERVRQTYKEDVDMLAILNSDRAKAEKWKRNVTALYPVAFDESGSLIQQYQAKRGVYIMLLEPKPDGTASILKVYPGYSKSMLQDLGDQIAKVSKVAPRKVDTKYAPEQLVSGCAFPTPALGSSQ